MLLAKIDTTAYPVVRIESSYPLKLPSHLKNMLEFYPKEANDPFLTYFREDENENAKFHNTFTGCRADYLRQSIIGVETGRIKGTRGNIKEVDR